jgi:hypothetical protein
MFRKIRNIRNLGNVHIRGPHIVMSGTDAQNGLDFHFKYYAHWDCYYEIWIWNNKIRGVDILSSFQRTIPSPIPREIFA